MSDEILTHADARAILGLPPDAGPETLIGAFRAAVKATHPDRPGGDANRFRAVLEAYRLLQSAWEPPTSPQPPLGGAIVDVAPLLAMTGGDVWAVLASGRRVRTSIAPGVREGEVLQVAGKPLRVRIPADATMQVRGSDIWITATVAQNLLAEGGRAVLQTPLGRKAVWITRKIAERRLIRLPGRGLPARDEHPQGDLFIRLTPGAGAPESAARAQLRKFAAAWAA